MMKSVMLTLILKVSNYSVFGNRFGSLCFHTSTAYMYHTYFLVCHFK